MNNMEGKFAHVNAKEIREALQNNCFYVYAMDRDGQEWRIINAKTHAGAVEGQALITGSWFTIKSWEQR